MRNIVESIAITSDDRRKIVTNATLIEGYGIENDQKRSEDRQISLVSDKFIVNKNTIDLGFCHKKFKENLIIMHLDVKSLDILDKFLIGDSIIEITQVYKKCHDKCQLYDNSKICEINKEVAFARVIKTGHIKVDDLMIKL